MPTYRFLDTAKLNRRPASYEEVKLNRLPPVTLGLPPILRRPAPNPPQFSGTFATPGIRNVYLRRLGTDYFFEKTASNSAGYFFFSGIYDETFQYEFVVIDNDGTVSQVFHVDNPVYTRWLGNPTVNDSSGIPRT